MTGLRPALAGYLDLRRGLGFKLDRDEKLLDQFIAYLEERGTGTVTVTDALAWATLPAGASPGWLRMRMTVVRGFAAYLATLDPAAEVPPAEPAARRQPPRGALPVFRRRHRRADGPGGAAADAAAPGDHPDPDRLAGGHRHARSARRSRLDDGDFDPGAGCCWCAHAKLGKHRLLPLHPTTVTAVQDYRRLRDQRVPAPGQRRRCWCPAAGTRLLHYNVSLTFATAGPPRRDWPAAPAAAVPGRMICVIRSRSPRCWTGTATAATSPPGCRCCRPTSATPTRPAPTGTCRPPRNCSPRPPAGSATRAGRAPVTAIAADHAGVLHRAADRPAAGQPAHDRRLPRHPAAAARLRRRSAPGRCPAGSTSPTWTPPMIGAFLDHLEHERGNSIRTRNARLAAIHSLFGFAALRHPEHAADIARVLAIPPKRADQARSSPSSPTTRPSALLAAPDRATRTGRRDHAWIAARHPDRAAGLRAHRADLRATSTSAPAPTSPATARAAKTGSPR